MPPEDDKDLKKDPPKDDTVEDNQQSGEDQAAVEAEAKLLGWVPKEEFHGKEEDWADAATFVQRGKEINPILRKNNQRLMKELDKRDKQIAELQLTQKEFGEMYAKMSENAYKRAIEDLKSQRKAARRDGNEDDAEALTDQIEELEKASKDVKIPGQNVGTVDQAAEVKAREAVFNDWVGENSWFDEEKNPRLYHAAQGIAIAFAKTAEGKALAGKKEFLDEIATRAKKLYPEDFKNKNREKGSPVGNTERSRSDGGPGGRKTYADLPPEAKAACDRQVKSIPKFTREKYVQYYFEQEGV